MNELYGASEQEVPQVPTGEGLCSLPWVPGKEKPFLDGTLIPQSFLLLVPLHSVTFTYHLPAPDVIKPVLS